MACPRCQFLRPRWPSLYAARRRYLDPQIALPILPDSFLGWIPALYRVTDAQVLASAGLDAFVFLSFFKMSMRLFAVMTFFAAAVLWPINNSAHVYPPGDKRSGSPFAEFPSSDASASAVIGKHKSDPSLELSYLWAYLAFTWFFSFLTVYYLNSETFKILKVRQEYLGTQRTVTDRTFRLTGIPEDLRAEDKIKEFVENLEIGHVRSVTLCRDWAELDGIMAERNAVLRKLEEAWSVYLSQKPQKPAARVAIRRGPLGTDPDGLDVDQLGVDGGENGHLLAHDSLRGLVTERERPMTRIRYGFMKLWSRQIDAIDYFEEKLRRLDEQVQEARRKEYEPQSTAFVTMDSIAASQMAIQALIDPRPGQLLSKPAPSPSDVVWKNTYTPRYRRRLQSWLITLFITFLTLIWITPVVFLASLLNICTIDKVSHSLANVLMSHSITKVLVQTALPVGFVSLLNIAVPYLYDYLSNHQGMISQGDVELSVVSKNFFFTFFNVFLVFAISGSASTFWPRLTESFSKDARAIAKELAKSIWGLIDFYISFITLQGIGLMPFRLLQFGGVLVRPIYRMGAKTPRDYADLARPTLFTYGFYLPTALLVFILCLVYSIMPRSHLVLLGGVCYFTLGYFVYKYQLLYSMDQPQHATGGAWRIICSRIIIGLILFQVVMVGTLSLQLAWVQAAAVAPLLVLTIWYNHYFNQRFRPLTVFVALRSLKREGEARGTTATNADRDPGLRVPQNRLTRRLSTIDEDKEKGMQFMNPSLVAPLQQPWVYHDPPRPPSSSRASTMSGFTADLVEVDETGERPPQIQVNGRNGGYGSGSSSFSLGDTHVWRDNGGDNV